MAIHRRSGARFSPFTYQEMLAPILEIQKVHDEIEKNYGALKTQAMQWQNKADREKDPTAHAQYSRYAADLANQAAALARSGVTPLMKQGIYDMASRYAAEVHPIEEAYKRRLLLAEEQRKLEQSDPTRMFERQAKAMSLDDFLENPTADYGKSVSGELLRQQVAQAAAVLAKEARDSEEGRGKLEKITLPYQYEYIKKSGFSREAVLQAILRSPNANKVLTGLVDQVLESSGVLQWGDKETIKRAYKYAGQGLYQAIGGTTSQLVTDTYSMQDALAKKEAARRRAEAAKAAKRAGIAPNWVIPTNIKGGRLNPRALRSKVELNKTNALINKYKDKYFTFDKKKGHYVLNAAGANALRLPMKGSAYTPSRQMADYAGKNVPDPDFYNFMKSINGGKEIYITNNGEVGFWSTTMGKDTYKGVTGPGNAGLLFQKYVNQNKEGAYDTYHSTEYVHALNESDGKEAMRQIQGNAKGKYREVDFNGTNGWNTVNTLDDKSLAGYSVQSFNYSKYGVTATLTKDGAPSIRLALPKDYSSWYQQNATNLAKQASVYDDYMNMSTPQIPIFGNDGDVIATYKIKGPEDKAKAEEIRDNILYDVMNFGINIPVTTGVKEEEYNQF